MYLICILYTLYIYQIISYYVSIKYYMKIYNIIRTTNDILSFGLKRCVSAPKHM